MPPISSKKREDEFREAALDLVGEQGYDCVTMDAIAARTRSSKATLYRRWSSKADLVIDALRQRIAPLAEPPDTGSLREDLIEALRTIAGDQEKDINMGLSMLAAARRDPDLMDLLRGTFYGPLYAATGLLLKRAVARGVLPDEGDPEFVSKVSAAMLLYRGAWSEGPMDRAFIEDVVDKVVLPLVYGNCDQSSAVGSHYGRSDIGRRKLRG